MSKFRTTRSQQTGATITVATAVDARLDPSEGDCKWYTICEDHNEVCGHTTKKLAVFFAASPLDWCDGCREAMDAKGFANLFNVADELAGGLELSDLRADVVKSARDYARQSNVSWPPSLSEVEDLFNARSAR